MSGHHHEPLLLLSPLPRRALASTSRRAAAGASHVDATARRAARGALTAVLVGLYKIAPENTKAINIHKAHDSILDLFDLNDVPKGITGSVGKVDPQDPAHIAKMDRMRREGAGAGKPISCIHKEEYCRQ